MDYRKLGRSDLLASVIGFGCMSLSKTGEKEAKDLIAGALDAGINYFDTADLYDKGANEALVGRALKPVRDKVIIATKVGNEWRADGSGWDWNPRKAYILKAVNDSLRRLQTDYIDLYQLHGGTIDDPADETIEAFEQLVQQGKIRYYGLSSIRPNVIRAYVERSRIVSVMLQYSLLDRRPEEEVLNYLRQHEVSALARGVLAQGLLANKPARDHLGYSREQVLRLQEGLREAGFPTGVALQYVLENAAVGAAVIGFRTIQQLGEVISAWEAVREAGLTGSLAQILVPQTYTDHR